MKIGKTPESKPQRRGSFAEVEKFLDRHGGNSSPLIWSEDTDPAKVEAWRASGKQSRLKPKTGAFYRRTTTAIDVLGDKSNLVNWKVCKAIAGILESPQLIDQFNALDDPFGADKGDARKIAHEAQEVAGTSDRATAGTAIHAFLEDVDAGEDPGYIPEENEADVAAYIEATSDLEVLGIELFGVLDEFKIGGTMDRVVAVHGKTAEAIGVEDGTVVVADLKTSASMDYDQGKFALQLAAYAHMKLYNVETFERTDIYPGLNQEVGIIIHLPLCEGTCTLYAVDLVKGWEGLELCAAVNDWRTYWNAKKNKMQAL